MTNIGRPGLAPEDHHGIIICRRGEEYVVMVVVVVVGCLQVITLNILPGHNTANTGAVLCRDLLSPGSLLIIHNPLYFTAGQAVSAWC